MAKLIKATPARKILPAQFLEIQFHSYIFKVRTKRFPCVVYVGHRTKKNAILPPCPGFTRPDQSASKEIHTSLARHWDSTYWMRFTNHERISKLRAASDIASTFGHSPALRALSLYPLRFGHGPSTTAPKTIIIIPAAMM